MTFKLLKHIIQTVKKKMREIGMDKTQLEITIPGMKMAISRLKLSTLMDLFKQPLVGMRLVYGVSGMRMAIKNQKASMRLKMDVWGNGAFGIQMLH